MLNVITASSSSEVSKPIISDPRLRKLTFTGSTEVGRKLVEQSAEGLLRTSMELGGNAPFIVFADADLDAAVEGAVIAKMRNIGEACTAANRFHVADRVAEEFAEKLAGKLGEMKVGRGTEEDVKVGPLIDADQRGKVAELVQDATGKGAQVLVGGRERDGAGYFYEPTVLGGVTSDADLLKEEIFGPVAPVIGFDDEEAAIAAANDTEYGLVAYVYTRDIKRAFRVVEKLETGMVGLNQGIVSNPAAPFGGVKASGLRARGRAGGDRRVPGDQVRRDGDVNPLTLVREWFEEAAASGIIEAERMALATASPDGRPSVRIVLLKGIDEDGIRFFTNYTSRKGRELDANPRAAATLYWQPLYRAARLEGPVERLTAEESDAYFATRPRGAQVGAWASAQGSVMRDRAELDDARGGDRGALPGHRSPTRLLGRLPPNAGRRRALAGPPRPPPRPPSTSCSQPDGSWRSERLSP